MHETSIDLNADMGESFGAWTMGDDAALMPWITSANVACGFHAGDPSTVAATTVALNNEVTAVQELSNGSVLVAGWFSGTLTLAGTPVTAALWQGGIAACQFHPEKSGLAGEAMLRRWLGWVAAP